MEGMNIQNIIAMMNGMPTGGFVNRDDYYSKFRSSQDINRLIYGAPENWKNEESLLMRIINGGM